MKVQLAIVLGALATAFLSVAPADADLLAWYRMGDDDASPVEGVQIPRQNGGISNHPHLSSDGAWGVLRGRPVAPATEGRPLYSVNVPGPEIYDPLGDQTYGNLWSIKTQLPVGSDSGSLGSAANYRFDPEFTFEFFLYFDVEDMASVRNLEFSRHRNEANGGWRLFVENAEGDNQDKVRVQMETLPPEATTAVAWNFHGTTKLVPQTWYHLALTYEANEDTSNTARLYINHALDGSADSELGHMFGTGQHQIYLGNISGGSSSTRTITIDEFRYFENQVLTPDSFLQVVFPPVPGDYNGDGVVNASDYAVWRDSLGGPENSLLNRDPENSEEINLGDYDFWRAHFGSTYSSEASSQVAAVPEPAAALLIGIAAAGWMTVRSRKRQPRCSHH